MTKEKNGTDPKAADNQTPEEGATDKQGSANQDDVVTLPKKDYDELVSKRDANFEEARKAKDENKSLEQRLSDLEQKDTLQSSIDTFLADNAEKYPDVDTEDLTLAKSPDDLEAIATRVQSKAEAVREKEIESSRHTPQPTLSPEEYKEKEKELSESAEEDPEAFEKMLQAQGMVDPDKE